MLIGQKIFNVVGIQYKTRWACHVQQTTSQQQNMRKMQQKNSGSALSEMQVIVVASIEIITKTNADRYHYINQFQKMMQTAKRNSAPSYQRANSDSNKNMQNVDADNCVKPCEIIKTSC